MPLLDLQKLTVGLSRTWAGYLGECSPDPDADAAAEDPCEVSRAHVEAFQAWMLETRSASTALNKHKGLQQFFKWLLVDEEAISGRRWSGCASRRRRRS